jgi:hypothetical protein
VTKPAPFINYALVAGQRAAHDWYEAWSRERAKKTRKKVKK